MQIKKQKIILASGSPRRSFLLNQIEVKHKVLKIDFDEDIPLGTPFYSTAEKLATHKQSQIKKKLKNHIYITADTIVVIKNNILGKPKDRKTAIKYLKTLSNKKHKVITGVSISSTKKQVTFQCTSIVHFKKLSHKEITHYVDKYKPYDKAGAYGIQEWIGMIGIKKIKGSYFNIMGLPTHKLKKQLDQFLLG